MTDTDPTTGSLIEDALAFGAAVGGEFDKWITWAVSVIRDRNERIEELETEIERLRAALREASEYCSRPDGACLDKGVWLTDE